MNTNTSWMELQLDSLEKMTASDWHYDVHAYHADRLASVYRGLTGWDAYGIPAAKLAELKARCEAVTKAKQTA